MGKLFDTIHQSEGRDAVVVRKLAEIIRTLAVHGHAVLVGRGSYLVTQDLRNGMHVRLVAPRAWRVHTIAANRQSLTCEAEKMVADGERRREHYINTFFVLDPDFPFHPRSGHRQFAIQPGANRRDRVHRVERSLARRWARNGEILSLPRRKLSASCHFFQYVSFTPAFLLPQRASVNSASLRRFK